MRWESITDNPVRSGFGPVRAPAWLFQTFIPVSRTYQTADRPTGSWINQKLTMGLSGMRAPIFRLLGGGSNLLVCLVISKSDDEN